MIVYSASREEFGRHVNTNQIDSKILDRFLVRLGHRTSRREIESWRNSMVYMDNALSLGEIPPDANVAIEYQVPLTSKRVDFLLAGTDSNSRENVVIVELKQWSEVSASNKDAIVETFLGGGKHEVTHPSYQAWTYAALIRDFNVEVQENDISLWPCAYLHNCSNPSEVKSAFYSEHLSKAPLFIRSDVEELGKFLGRHVRQGDHSQTLRRIDEGRLRPSKNLADHLSSLLGGNPEFLMIDEQKIVFETALDLAKQAENSKQVLLVEGGPGTGKSVVAINLLVDFIRQGKLAQYVSRNAAPRAVYESKLTGAMRKSRVSNLFKGSGSFIESAANAIDVLIVDEAHRLNEKSGLFQNQGENQISEIIEASKFSVFFLDQDQRVTLKDIGEREEIRRRVRASQANLTELKLDSQFRCNGSDGYLSWVNNTLQIDETAHDTLQGINYDFQVFDSPNDMHSKITELNGESNKARMVAGYCWDWKGKKDADVKDVVIPEHGFEMRWNLDSDGPLWLISPSSIEEIGCIHTCQGLELDYVGVIFGEDLVVRNGKVITDALKRSSQDRSVHGYKKMHRENPEFAQKLGDRIIKNTYRTLMTRGQRGCFVYSVDPETAAYFETCM